MDPRVYKFLLDWRKGKYNARTGKQVSANNIARVSAYRRGKYEVPVFRGMHFSWNTIDQNWDIITKQTLVTTRPTSWTFDEDIARDFASKGAYGVVLKLFIRPEDVVFDLEAVGHPNFESWLEEEREIVLAAGTYRVALTHSRLPDVNKAAELRVALEQARASVPNLVVSANDKLLFITPTKTRAPWEITVSLARLDTAEVRTDARYVRLSPANARNLSTRNIMIAGSVAGQTATLPVQRLPEVVRALARATI